MKFLRKLMNRSSLPRAQTLNLLICGAMRSGTTSLKYYMEEHPELGFVGEGNTDIDGVRVGFPFSSPVLARSILGEDPTIYERICERHAGKKAYIATKQPYFMAYPHVPLNLRDQLPDVKMVFILRNPIETVYSAYCKKIRDGKGDGRSFEEFLRKAEEDSVDVSDPRKRGAWPNLLRDPEKAPFVVDRGFYYQQIKRFYSCFGEEQILVLNFTQFVKNPEVTMREVLGFLNLDPSFRFTRLGEVRNAAPKPVPMSAETRFYLSALYAGSSSRLLQFLGWPLDLWD